MTDSRPIDGTPALGVGPAVPVVLAFLFYLLTMAPDVLWADSGKFQWMAWAGWLRVDETGHPLWVLIHYPLAHLPGVSPARVLNIASGLLSALSLWPAFRIMRRLRVSTPAAWIACLALAVSHTFWFHAVITEVYALNSLVSLVLLDAVMAATAPGAGRPAGAAVWGALGLVWGLASANHPLVALWLPGCLWFIARGWRSGRVRLAGCVAAASGAVLGVTPILLFRITHGKGETIATLVARFWHDAVHLERLGRGLIAIGGYLLYQFPIPLMLAAAAIGVARVRSDARSGLLLLWAVSAGFGCVHQVRDRFAFLLPSYLIVAILAGVGLDPILTWLRRHLPAPAGLAMVILVCVVSPPVVYHLVARSAMVGELHDVDEARWIPHRDPAIYFLDPDKRGYDGARRFAAEVFDTLETDAVLIADATIAEPLNYLQIVEQRRPDVLVTWMAPASQADAARGWARSGRPVYVAGLDRHYQVEALTDSFDIEPAGPVYRLSQPTPTIHDGSRAILARRPVRQANAGPAVIPDWRDLCPELMLLANIDIDLGPVRIRRIVSASESAGGVVLLRVARNRRPRRPPHGWPGWKAGRFPTRSGRPAFQLCSRAGLTWHPQQPMMRGPSTGNAARIPWRPT